MRRRSHSVYFIFLCFSISTCSQTTTSNAFVVEPARYKTSPARVFGSLDDLISQQNPPEVPQENPLAESERALFSKSGVRYRDVLDALNELYPPQQLEQRNAASRTDGYWHYINNGLEPPKQYTYGEFDFYFFAQLLDCASDYYYLEQDDHITDLVFMDFGSGTGRLVLAAAALHPEWKCCRGIEVLPSIHEVALEKLAQCRRVEEEDQDSDTVWRAPYSGYITPTSDKGNDNDWCNDLTDQLLSPTQPDSVISKEVGDGDNIEVETTLVSEPSSATTEADDNDNKSRYAGDYALSSNSSVFRLAPVEFVCNTFEDPYEYFGDVNIVFCFSSCMSPDILTRLATALGRQCKPGTIVITTEFMLPLKGTIEANLNDEAPAGTFEFELLDRISGYCWLTGGQSTAYIHVVKQSLEVRKRKRPQPTPEERAFEIVRDREEGTLSDYKKFLLQIYNDCLFYGFPKSWRPKLDDEEE